MVTRRIERKVNPINNMPKLFGPRFEVYDEDSEIFIAVSKDHGRTWKRGVITVSEKCSAFEIATVVSNKEKIGTFVCVGDETPYLFVKTGVKFPGMKKTIPNITYLKRLPFEPDSTIVEKENKIKVNMRVREGTIN